LNVSLIEIDALSKATTKSLPESIAINDVLTTAAVTNNLNPLSTESIAINDALSKATTKSLTESISINETFNTQLNHNNPLSTESITINDALSKATTKSLTESITINDALSKSTSKSLTESITINETLSKATTKSLTESITINETFNLTSFGPATSGIGAPNTFLDITGHTIDTLSDVMLIATIAIQDASPGVVAVSWDDNGDGNDVCDGTADGTAMTLISDGEGDTASQSGTNGLVVVYALALGNTIGTITGDLCIETTAKMDRLA